MSKILRFGIAGGIGFVVDTALLYMLIDALGPYMARAMSFVAAVTTTWAINRVFAFRAHPKHLPLWREYSQYFLAMITGGLINYAVYAGLMASVQPVKVYPVIGVFFGTLTGMGVNFFLAQRFVFGRAPEQS